MPRKKKVLLKPKSELGINKELPICWNCMWRHRDTGFVLCIWNIMTTITDVQHERYSDIVLKEWMKDI